MAQAYAKKRWPVFPVCWPAVDGSCACGGKWDDAAGQLVPHSAKEVGKAPVGRLARQGVKDATTNSATIDRWWHAMPLANVGIALEAAGLLLVDPDSTETEAAAISRGLGGGVVRESRNRAYVFSRPATCPTVNIIKQDGAPLDIMATGHVVAHGTHGTGVSVRLDPKPAPGPAPSWAVDLLTAKAAENAARDATTAARRMERATQGGGEPPVRLRPRGLQRWTGELVEIRDGKMDRSESLFFLGLDLAEAGASEGTVVSALAERDESLGWRKFTGRRDADRRYEEIAEKAVARAIEQEQVRFAPTHAPLPTAEMPSETDPTETSTDDPEHLNCPIRGLLLDRDDRLEVLEDIVHSIDDVLNRPQEEMSASDKVILIGTARWLPYYRSKKEHEGQPATVALGYVAKICGTSKSTVSATLKRFSSTKAEDGAAFLKIKYRKAHWDEDGQPIINPKTGKQLFTTPVEYVPMGQRPAETLRAAVAQAQVNRRKKHGGSQEAADARWGRCEKHNNQKVLVKGYCPDCGKVVGERTVNIEEFNALDKQVAHPEPETQSAQPVSRYSIGKQVAHSERPPARREPLLADPPDWPDYEPGFDASPEPLPPTPIGHHARSRSSGWRCPCGSTERYIRNGLYNCSKCGLRGQVEPLPAVAGGSD